MNEEICEIQIIVHLVMFERNRKRRCRGGVDDSHEDNDLRRNKIKIQIVSKQHFQLVPQSNSHT